MDEIAVIILAAGKGTRMKSDLAKVLHPVAGKSMINHVVASAKKVAPDHIHVVVGHQADRVKAEVLKFNSVRFALQTDLLGTGDAVKSALPDLGDAVATVLVLCGDVPLIRVETIRELVNSHISCQSYLTVLAVRMDDPAGYGRIIRDGAGNLLAIREEADADEDEKKIDLINSGIYCFNRCFLETGIQRVENNNNQSEYYLTDLVEIAVADGLKTAVVTTADHRQVMGVNTLAQLACAETVFKSRQNELS